MKRDFRAGFQVSPPAPPGRSWRVTLQLFLNLTPRSRASPWQRQQPQRRGSDATAAIFIGDQPLGLIVPSGSINLVYNTAGRPLGSSPAV